MFRNLAEYETYVRTLVDAGIVPNATYVWWALRPSLQHPTLELRITDCCTAIADSVAIAALFRALVRHAVHHPDLNATYSAVHRALIEENRWRAQRYGTDGTYIDLASFEPVWLQELARGGDRDAGARHRASSASRTMSSTSRPSRSAARRRIFSWSTSGA